MALVNYKGWSRFFFLKPLMLTKCKLFLRSWLFRHVLLWYRQGPQGRRLCRMCQQDCFREDLPGESVQMFKMFKCSKMLKCSNIPKNWQVQAWGSSSPHKHGMTSLKEHGNNCRNPDNYSSPWYVPFQRLLCFGKLVSFGLIFEQPKIKEKLLVVHPSL